MKIKSILILLIFLRVSRQLLQEMGRAKIANQFVLQLGLQFLAHHQSAHST